MNIVAKSLAVIFCFLPGQQMTRHCKVASSFEINKRSIAGHQTLCRCSFRVIIRSCWCPWEECKNYGPFEFDDKNVFFFWIMLTTAKICAVVAKCKETRLVLFPIKVSQCKRYCKSKMLRHTDIRRKICCKKHRSYKYIRLILRYISNY